MKKLIVGVLGLFLAGGCAPVVKMQSIPVSTNPMGATVYTDGQVACTSPCSVDLARNAEHIITLKKDQYEQHDVIIKRVYQQEKVMMNAVSQGLQSSSMAVGGDSTAWGVMQGVNSIDSQEQTGDAYVLSPSAVSVRLVPVNQQGHDSSVDTPDVDSVAPPKTDSENFVKDALKAGAMAAPNIHGGVTGKSGSSNESWDGNTYRKDSSETKVKASVNVNPAKALEALDALVK